MFNRLVEGTRLAAEGLFGNRFGMFELLERSGKLPQNIDSYVDHQLVIRRPAVIANDVIPARLDDLPEAA